MSEKKHPKHQAEEPRHPAPEGGPAASEGKPSEVEALNQAPPSPEGEELKVTAYEVEELKNKLAAAEAKSAEYLDGWQRTQAEFSNFKKRLERDNETTYLLMKGDLIRKFLPILDDLERALQSKPHQEVAEAWAGGIELIIHKLQALLEAEGVKRIEAEGAAFDPNLHEAITQEAADGVKSGHIIAVVRNGYMLGDRVIRPAQVRVAQ